MVGIVFIAMFIGSLSAVSLAFSGWSLWVAIAAYIGSGILGLTMMVVAEICRAPLSKGIRLVVASASRMDFWRQEGDAYLQPRPIPSLSEYQFNTTRK